MARRMYVVGNWKMHGLSNDLAEIQAIADGARARPEVDVALCVPSILIERAWIEYAASAALSEDDRDRRYSDECGDADRDKSTIHTTLQFVNS